MILALLYSQLYLKYYLKLYLEVYSLLSDAHIKLRNNLNQFQCHIFDFQY